MAKPYRDAFTITRQDDGAWECKQHGYPFYFTGSTAEECLRNAGKSVDMQFKCVQMASSVDPSFDDGTVLER